MFKLKINIRIIILHFLNILSSFKLIGPTSKIRRESDGMVILYYPKEVFYMEDKDNNISMNIGILHNRRWINISAMVQGIEFTLQYFPVSKEKDTDHARWEVSRYNRETSKFIEISYPVIDKPNIGPDRLSAFLWQFGADCPAPDKLQKYFIWIQVKGFLEELICE